MFPKAILGYNVAGPGPYAPLTTSLQGDGAQIGVGHGNYAGIDLEYNQPFSGAIWFKVPPGGGGSLITKMDWGGQQGWDFQVLTGATAGDLWLRLMNGLGATFHQRCASAVDDNAWHHAAFAYGGGNDPTDIDLYIDNALQIPVLSGIGFAAGSIKNVQELMSGGMFNTLLTRFSGRWCHPGFWNKKLTAVEVAEDYGTGVPITRNLAAAEPNLYAWCTVGDGCAVGAGNCPDISGRGVNGTAYNAAPGDFVLDVPP